MSFHHILFPVDFSEHARATAPAVAAMARHDGARVTLLQSLDMPYGEMGAAPIEGEIEKARLHQRLRLQEFLPELWEGLEVARVEAQGKPVQTITAHASTHGVDLIMLPTHGFTRFRPLLLGSVAAGVLHDAECPVWTTAHSERPATPRGYRNVVCAIDGGPRRVDVLRMAVGLAAGWQASLSVVHSIPVIDERFYSAAAARAHQHLIDLAVREYPALAAEAGVEAALEIVEGDGLNGPIVEAARTREADLLIIGRGTIQGFLGRLRSNAHELIRTSPCPVLSV